MQKQLNGVAYTVVCEYPTLWTGYRTLDPDMAEVVMTGSGFNQKVLLTYEAMKTMLGGMEKLRADRDEEFNREWEAAMKRQEMDAEQKKEIEGGNAA